MTRQFYSSHSHAILTGCYLHEKIHWEMRCSTHSVLETIHDGFSWIQDFILSASCYDGYGAKLTQLLLVLSGDVELNPGPFNRDEDIGE